MFYFFQHKISHSIKLSATQNDLCLPVGKGIRNHQEIKDNNQTEIVELEVAVTDKEKKNGQLLKFEESFNAKSIDDRKFFLQKLNYVHLNPVCGHHELVNDWIDYEHSSGGFYALQQVKHFVPFHYEELK